MKFLCDACSRLVDVSEYTLRSGSLVLVCPVCKMECSAGPPTPKKPATVLELAKPRPPPEGPFCPKCGAPHPAEQLSCARCGLVFALFNPEHLALPAPLEELWAAAEAAWTNTEKHDAFLAACGLAGMGVLTEAARRYRVRSEQDPADVIAGRFRDESSSRLLALSSLPMESGDHHVLHRVRLVLIGIFLALCAALFVTVIYRLWHPGP